MIDPIQAFMQANALTVPAFPPEGRCWGTGRLFEQINRGPDRVERPRHRPYQHSHSQ